MHLNEKLCETMPETDADDLLQCYFTMAGDETLGYIRAEFSGPHRKKRVRVLIARMGITVKCVRSDSLWGIQKSTHILARSWQGWKKWHIQ